MKLIYPNTATDVSSDTENASFPATNVLDEHPKRVWKATGSTAILSLGVPAGTNTAAIFNTNATSASVIARSGSIVTWTPTISWESDVSWLTAASVSTIFDLSPSGVGSLWAEYTSINNAHIIDFELSNSEGSIIYAGIARAGAGKSFKDPKYGIKEGLEDNSIKKKLSNGARYYRKRDVVRMFGFEILFTRDPDFYTFMLTVAQQVGPEPIAWRISTNNTDFEWVVFCAFGDKMPDGSHDSPNYSNLNVRLIEVV